MNWMCSKKFWFGVGLLYAVTWVGGYFSHRSALRRQAAVLYAATKRYDESLRKTGELSHPPVFGHGPAVRVNWCVPLFPGILLADSRYSIAPLNAHGGRKLVFYYLFGSGYKEVFAQWAA